MGRKKYQSEAEKYSKILEILSNMEEGKFENITNLSRKANINPSEQGKFAFDLLESAKEVLSPINFLRNEKLELKGVWKSPEEESENLIFIKKELESIKKELKKIWKQKK